MAKQTLIEKLRKLALIESHKDEVKMQQHPAWKAAKRLEKAEALLWKSIGTMYKPGMPATELTCEIDEFLADG